MTVDTNSTALHEPLIVRSGPLAADIRTIGDAAAFIRNLPKSFDGRLHWSLAASAITAAGIYPGNADLLWIATLAMKNALATEGLLVDFNPLIAAWEGRRAMLALQLEWLEAGYMRNGSNPRDSTTNQDIARLRSWIAELDALMTEHSK
jgi:hypothetical protein